MYDCSMSCAQTNLSEATSIEAKTQESFLTPKSRQSSCVCRQACVVRTTVHDYADTWREMGDDDDDDMKQSDDETPA